MRIEKIKKSDIKRINDSLILNESWSRCPIVILTNDYEVIFGYKYIESIPDDEFECIIVDCESEEEKKKLEFGLHYVGMTCEIGYKNFNKIGAKNLGLPEMLYLWDINQFEAAAKKENWVKHSTSSNDLF